MGCFVVAQFLLTSVSRVPSAIAETLVKVNCWQFNNLHACLYNSWNVNKDWFSSCWGIGRYRPILHNFQFLPHLTQKLLNQFSPFFIRCRAISGAINAHIHITIVHPVLKWKGAEWRSFRKFYPKLVAMATSFEISRKRSRSIICTQNAFIRWKDCENRSSGS